MAALIMFYETLDLVIYFNPTFGEASAGVTFHFQHLVFVDTLYDMLFSFMPCLFAFGWWLHDNKHHTKAWKLHYVFVTSCIALSLPFLVPVDSESYEESWMDDADNFISGSLFVGIFSILGDINCSKRTTTTAKSSKQRKENKKNFDIFSIIFVIAFSGVLYELFEYILLHSGDVSSIDNWDSLEESTKDILGFVLGYILFIIVLPEDQRETFPVLFITSSYGVVLAIASVLIPILYQWLVGDLSNLWNVDEAMKKVFESEHDVSATNFSESFDFDSDKTSTLDGAATMLRNP